MTLPEHDASYETFRTVRDHLLRHRTDLVAAVAGYRPPDLPYFNWALDWFDIVAAAPQTGDRTALWVVDCDADGGTVHTKLTYRELSLRSAQLAAWLQANGVHRGDRVLVVLGNQVELWETMLACAKLGAVVIAASTLLGPADVADRVHRGHVAHVVARSVDTLKFADVSGGWTRIAVGPDVAGWLSFADSREHLHTFTPQVPTAAQDPLLLYFTSGTTAQPKLVEHTHVSYPVGHLSTMYWIGLQPGDVHLNISSPGWAKHAWSSFFAPWNAEATVLVVNQERFAPGPLLEVMADCGVSTFCAPPTVWRMLVQHDLTPYRGRIPLREVVGAGEPLNPEVIEQVRRAWDLSIRDGFGQTETTAQVGNSPGAPLKPGSMGRPLPGYDVVLLDPATGESTDEGEMCLRLDGPLGRPVGLMAGYHGDRSRTEDAMRHNAYHTGDVASQDDDGYLAYVGRADDVFKASDYRISPFELESVLIEHPAVVEAAVVPSPDPLRLAVPKAYVVLADGWAPSAETASAILTHARAALPAYQRIRRIEFVVDDEGLPKTVSGKIRRVDLRRREHTVHGTGADRTSRAGHTEFWEEDLRT